MAQIARSRFALGSYHYLRYPMEYFLDTAVELGIENVELWAAAPQLFLQLTGPDRVRTLHGQLRSRGAACGVHYAGAVQLPHQPGQRGR